MSPFRRYCAESNSAPGRGALAQRVHIACIGSSRAPLAVLAPQVIIEGFKSYKEQTALDPFNSKLNVVGELHRPRRAQRGGPSGLSGSLRGAESTPAQCLDVMKHTSRASSVKVARAGRTNLSSLRASPGARRAGPGPLFAPAPSLPTVAVSVHPWTPPSRSQTPRARLRSGRERFGQKQLLLGHPLRRQRCADAAERGEQTKAPARGRGPGRAPGADCPGPTALPSAPMSHVAREPRPAARPPPQAYVEVVFDNTDRRLPVERDEVRLRRMVSAKGDDYSLDRRAITKEEVGKVLESAGFSRSNPYYVVQQGKIMQMSMMKEGERLSLLKEIGGTRVYEERRAESLRIIRDTEGQRRQVEEVIEDLNMRLHDLDREK